MKTWLCMSLLTVVGCAGADVGVLGIKDVLVKESATELQITGTDASGATIADLNLKLGKFTMSDDGRAADGRRLTVHVLGVTAMHESDGYRALLLPLINHPDQGPTNMFLTDGRVQPVLARWGVAFKQGGMSPPASRAPAPSEQPYTFCGYGTPLACAPTSCADFWEFASVWNGSYWADCIEVPYEYVCCGGASNGGSGTPTFVMRQCGMGSEDTCGNEGPNGCAPCWAASWSTSCSTYADGINMASCNDSLGYEVDDTQTVYGFDYN